MRLVRRAVTTAALAAATAGALVLGAGSASAATLPPSDGLYVIATDEGLFQLWQLLAVDPATADTSLIGESTTAPEDEFQVQGAYDRTTGIAYFIGDYRCLAAHDRRPGDGQLGRGRPDRGRP